MHGDTDEGGCARSPEGEIIGHGHGVANLMQKSIEARLVRDPK